MWLEKTRIQKVTCVNNNGPCLCMVIQVFVNNEKVYHAYAWRSGILILTSLKHEATL